MAGRRGKWRRTNAAQPADNIESTNMKRMILVTVAVMALGVGAAILIQNTWKPAVASTTSEPGAAGTTIPDNDAARPTAVSTHRQQPRRVEADSASEPADSTQPVTTVTTPGSGRRPSQPLVRQAVETLVSPQSTFVQRQAALERLRNSGKLDQAISDLEQRVADDPRSAEGPTALGRAYLEKCGTIQDIREQGILAMKADQAFDAALNVDASNWEARFTKAVAMSYWPTQMNLGTEVMQHFVTLIEQQEAQSPQPQFAQTYLWLGKEYAKYGHVQEAREIWQRGAALYPNDKELRSKLGTP